MANQRSQSGGSGRTPVSRGGNALSPSPTGAFDPLLRPRQQQREQFGAALAIDDPVDEIGSEATLESDHRFLRIRHIITETLEREQETRVRPVRVNEVARRARQRKPPLRQRMPGEQLARIFLPAGRDVRMADHVAAADSVPLLDVGNQRDDRGDLLVWELSIAELMARVDDLDADARGIDVADPAPARLAGVPGALGL